jgi:pilus assembly protein CpaB
MKIARVAVLGVALGAGVVAAVLAFNLTSRPPAPAAPVKQVRVSDTVQVLVASKDIPMGTTLNDGSLTWQDWPKTGTSDKFMVREGSGSEVTAKVLGSMARASFYQGEPITDAKLISADRGFMSAILPGGKRAVATRISADTSAGGFILPNDRVDVIMTRRNEDNAASSDPYLTETILNNVRVLAIDQTIEEQNGEKVVVGQTATLELTPQQVEILTVAQQLSDRLTLALRSIADSTVTPADSAADAIHLLGGTKRNGAVTIVKNGVAREVSGLR